MDDAQFEVLKAAIANELTAAQCVELEGVVREVSSRRVGETTLLLRTEALDGDRVCPRCGNTRIVKNGLDHLGRQRFRCVKHDDDEEERCGRGFNVLTGTPFARMRKPEKWLAYARLMMRSASITDIHESGIGISRLTAWRWRHRFLALPTTLQAERLDGIIEVDETYFRSSYKGSRAWKEGRPPENRPPRYRGGPAKRRGLSREQIPVLTAVDRSGGVVEGVMMRRAASVARTMLLGRIAEGAVPCSDGWAAYPQIAEACGADHRLVEAPRDDWLVRALGTGPRRPGRMGLGRINAHHERLKAFMNIVLRGVSTKYLPAYLGWLRFRRQPGFSPEALIRQPLLPQAG
ncbi:hypothetical protein C882_1896 [Caenispirillum salinarum AK4]|uniref:ISXO2-like transposase domain-containing protein n=1 Tax=Caenispirillum salinarum AK4 TaxID=1238182 RepID=K9GRM1_9PROT|nr:IS1595-like element ISCasa1 family transposase [Caenispirillum salinarum]EKV27394.1 hypothetical protein C882_1896 [Caenispirillum salinarum AK4]